MLEIIETQLRKQNKTHTKRLSIIDALYIDNYNNKNKIKKLKNIINIQKINNKNNNNSDDDNNIIIIV